MSYELTRRDAIAALSAAGVALAGCVAAPGTDERATDTDRQLTDHDRETMVATADVLYPTDVSGIEGFVERYVDGRIAERPEHAEGIADALAYLDEYCQAWFERDFTALSRKERDNALREMRANEATPDPDGSDIEQVRYYVINDLLLALYASPTGGQLVGIENPPGHPGGLDSYQRGPQS
ncbi:gluconate 2-dehydrogenase subunit 3 family protein [Halorhabdus sp. CBA1104]|uniref:gluconate 2-dehydrogenase subunit 3 family protein n=1 Tax=Halorhabdus sp. CBA1104 TaxID=1380432 RepID=UPI0012B1AD2F|nr:gluconate 2-dehydrogenase subunit 3 family protein [Halorhabdus sp. CBA1104]QGN08017.1 gluconate 2-dehydrogenase subunit 3 family protein [Halorhabdus sp. CBA1104]